MSQHRTIKRIGCKLREKLRDVIDAPTPEGMRELLKRIARLEQSGGLHLGDRRRWPG